MVDSHRGWKAFFNVLLNREEGKVERKWVYYLTVFSFLIRIPLLLYPEVIHNDATEYIRHARRILSWDWSLGKAHPLYPSFIALAHFFAPSDEIAGILVSAIFGALIVLPVFYLGKEIFNERVGLVAAVFAAFQPFLYMSSGSVLTESVFHFLLAISCLLGWRAFKRGRFVDIVLFGLFTSFSYLTRPEGIGFLLILSAWVLFVNPPDGKRHWTKKVAITAVVLLGFFVISSPYLIQLRKEAGRWQLSKKISVSVGSLSDEEKDLPLDMIRVKKQMTVSTFLKSPLSVMSKMAGGFFQSLYIFQQVYTPLLSLLLILGFVLNKGKSLSLKGNLYLASYVLYFFSFVHPFFWVTRRYTSHVISICLPWTAIGFLEVVGWARKRFSGERFQWKIPAILLIVILLLLCVQGRVIHTREHRFIQRDAGLWMKDHLPRGAKVMSSLPQEAFSAEMPWMKIPPGSYEEILATARSKEVRYLVIDDQIEEDSPDFLKKMKQEDLIPIKEWTRKAQRLVVYQIVSPEGSKP
jgi:4-amino-4-deoxy-L-arabinose transferase-like glycosyltransferase